MYGGLIFSLADTPQVSEPRQGSYHFVLRQGSTGKGVAVLEESAFDLTLPLEEFTVYTYIFMAFLSFILASTCLLEGLGLTGFSLKSVRELSMFWACPKSGTVLSTPVAISPWLSSACLRVPQAEMLQCSSVFSA